MLVESTSGAPAIKDSAAIGNGDTNSDVAQKNAIRRRAKDIHERAKANALAHKNAKEKNQNKAKIFITCDFVFSMGSMLATVFIFILSTNEAKTAFNVCVPPPATVQAAQKNEALSPQPADAIVVASVPAGSGKDCLSGADFEYRKIVVAILAICLTIGSLISSQTNNQRQYDTIASEHEWLLGAYQYIAQKARSLRWDDMPLEEMAHALRSMEEGFQLLKARGTEPSDADFEAAHAIIRKLDADALTKKMQGFQNEEGGNDVSNSDNAKGSTSIDLDQSKTS